MIQAQAQKKKKEEVQVYYVKYKHDEHKGLQVDAPIPALTPVGTNDDDEHDYESPAQADEPIIVTLPPPVKTTTLRAVIHPESEKFHAHGNVKITFGSEREHRQDNARQIAEYKNEESALQPVVAHPNSPNSVADFSQKDFTQPRVINTFNPSQVLPPQRPAVNFHSRPVAFGQQQQHHFSAPSPQPTIQFSREPPPSPPQNHQPQPSIQFNREPPQQNHQPQSTVQFSREPQPQLQNPQFLNQHSFSQNFGQFSRPSPPQQQFFDNRPQRPLSAPPRFQPQPTQQKGSKIAFPEQRFPQQNQPQSHQHRPIPIPIQHFQNG